ncbi:hypothetical protein [Roseateles violae]|uniref:Uncharacterized protein n=1 Tax=Roseateles violae TaxID=3058042 RepID=A0ABT8DU23_9BURK|nr:hypothetical protein [Pelomonas sp. PFR6]MDN3921498.1 hypothetical protein [Pelomonas sp. PFR6]
MRPYVLDLFGEVPVYHHDIDAWLRAVPRIEPGTRRAAHYVEAWSVVEKIKAAKLAGRFDEIVDQVEAPSPFWWTRFSWAR